MDKPTIGEFCWNELVTPNSKAAKDFYGKLFGWEFHDHDMGDMTYTMIKNDGKEFGGMWEIPKDKEKQIPPHWMGYILVKNIEESLAKASKEGASIKMPVTNVGDFGRFAIITDPTGASIALWQSMKENC